jgi:predicted nucleic acid-binding protein
MTHADDALAGLSRLGLDTTPFLYFVEGHPHFASLCTAVFTAVEEGEIEVYTSVLTLSEVLTRPLAVGDGALEGAFRDLLTRTRGVHLVAVSPAIGGIVSRLCFRYGGLRTADAVQIATAIASGCEAFLTGDARLKRVTEIRVLTLSDLAPANDAIADPIDGRNRTETVRLA